MLGAFATSTCYPGYSVLSYIFEITNNRALEKNTFLFTPDDTDKWKFLGVARGLLALVALNVVVCGLRSDAILPRATGIPGIPVFLPLDIQDSRQGLSRRAIKH